MPVKRGWPKKKSSSIEMQSPVKRNLFNVENDSLPIYGEVQNDIYVVKDASHSVSFSCEMPKKRHRPKKISLTMKKNYPVERKLIVAKRSLVSVEDDSPSAHGEMQNVFHVIKGVPKKISSTRAVVERNLFDDNDDLSSAHVEVPSETDADAVLLSLGSDATYKSNQTAVKRNVKSRPTKQKQNLSNMQDSLEGGGDSYNVQGGVDKSNPSTKPKFPCPECSRVFTRRNGLTRHQKYYRSDEPHEKFTCTVCNKEYTRKNTMKQHMRIHMGSRRILNKNHKCETCGKTFHGQSLLAIHLRVHTGEKPYSCEQCHKKFSTIYLLKKHENTHTGLKPFHCEECGQRFTQKSNLMTHMKLHAKVKPYACSYCPKQFLQLGGLKAHMFHHTGENGFECEECGNVFNRKDRLRMHRRYVHENCRPFRCKKCEKAFTRIEDLNQHTLVHTGEKPFSCSVCGKRFSAKKALRLHLLTHTEEEPVTCEECHRIFIRKDRLKYHIRK